MGTIMVPKWSTHCRRFLRTPSQPCRMWPTLASGRLTGHSWSLALCEGVLLLNGEDASSFYCNQSSDTHFDHPTRQASHRQSKSGSKLRASVRFEISPPSVTTASPC